MPPLGARADDQGFQAGGGVFQVVEHAAAVDVVEGAEAFQFQQRAAMEADVGQAARFGAAFGDGAGGVGEIDVGDLGGDAGVGALLRQHDRAVSRASSGEEDAERFGEVQTAAEDVVVDLVQVSGGAGDQAAGLVARVAGGIGVGLVLGAQEVGRHHPV